MREIQHEESTLNHQPHFNFAKTSTGNWHVPDSDVKPVRTAKELKFNMTQKRYDEENTIAQEVPEVKKNKVTTKGFFGGPTLQLKTSAQQFTNDKKWIGIANPQA